LISARKRGALDRIIGREICGFVNINVPAVRVGLGAAREWIVGPAWDSDGPGRGGAAALAAGVVTDVTGFGTPVGREGYWRAVEAALAVVFEAEVPMLCCVCVCVCVRDAGWAVRCGL